MPPYLHHGTQRGVQAMGPIFIPRDLNIKHREIHWKPLPQKNGIMSLEILNYLFPILDHFSTGI